MVELKMKDSWRPSLLSKEEYHKISLHLSVINIRKNVRRMIVHAENRALCVQVCPVVMKRKNVKTPNNLWMVLMMAVKLIHEMCCIVFILELLYMAACCCRS